MVSDGTQVPCTGAPQLEGVITMGCFYGTLRSIVSPLVGVVVAGDSGSSAVVSGPVTEALGAATRSSGASPVLVPVVGA